jgi:glycosyltransferase involved in cell wall biosynthesis
MIPWLETKKTLVLWHDATCFSLSRLSFDEFMARYPVLHELDTIILAKCDMVVFAADWLREQTLSCYDVPPEKVHVVPFGANLEPVSDRGPREAIAAREATTCRLTFLAIDWVGKRLPLAYDVLRSLKASGLQTELVTVGCEIRGPSRKHRLRHLFDLQPLSGIERFQSRFTCDPAVRQVGFLRKDDPLQYDELCRILQRTHFLLHPAEFESFGIALAEANAFGVPVLATAGYGPSTIIREGRNGFLYESADYVERASQLIREQMSDLPSYRTLAANSYLEYRERLNWMTSWQSVKALVAEESERQTLHRTARKQSGEETHGEGPS